MDKKTKALPEVSVVDIEKSKDDAWDFLYLFLDKYFEMIDKNQEVLNDFNTSQHVLLAYCYLDAQVCNGGFIQLIYNGYGAYVFNTPFADEIKLWGATKTAEIVERAKIIYDENRTEIEKETSMNEFMELYEKITKFEPLDNEYLKYTIKK
ncbi:MAG: DMP19 family protein [Campylobacteraceae bacterium]|jgi:hypothetical protein|nr:DMP19 family protein [Campylobacteraceae bacterium]